jgi:predicted amino acid-binding ACT domain protein
MENSEIILANINGEDKPGLTAALTEILTKAHGLVVRSGVFTDLLSVIEKLVILYILSRLSKVQNMFSTTLTILKTVFLIGI